MLHSYVSLSERQQIRGPTEPAPRSPFSVHRPAESADICKPRLLGHVLRFLYSNIYRPGGQSRMPAAEIGV